MSKIIVSETQKPPVGGMGGSVHDWERAKDPFHKDAFPAKFKNVGTGGTRKAGWIALDGWGNAIGFCADGAEFNISDTE